MNKKKIDAEHIFLYIIAFLVGIYLVLKIAPYLDQGLRGVILNATDIFKLSPISLTPKAAKNAAIFIMIYLAILLAYIFSTGNYRFRKEHGSAKWGLIDTLSNKYSDEDKLQNKIMTKSIGISFDSRKHMRNLNTLICGGSGAGKTRFYAKPNIMNANSSFVILDPKGELVHSTGKLLEEKGYEVKVLDLINMEKSHCYNPFLYLRNDNDIQRLATNIISSTKPPNAKGEDPFWDQAATMLLLALMFYLHYEAPVEEQNFAMVLELIRAGDIKENDENFLSPLDVLFGELEKKNPDHVAVKYYKSYRSGVAKTLKSIQITLISHLEKFNLNTLASITSIDELELNKLGEKKMAIFAVIPDNDTSFNFLVGVLYTQLFQQLYYSADFNHNGSLPIHVHFIMDEFANVAIPPDFTKLLATMRSRNISVSIIIQNLAQIKSLFEKDWESVVGNCDEFLYLGGNEQSTHEYISKLLGKETIDYNTYSKTKGRSGSYQKSSNILGRELLTPDEVRMMDNANALLFIRGEEPIIDKKYDILDHPNVALTADGGSDTYDYGQENISYLTFNGPCEIYKNEAKRQIHIFTEQDFDFKEKTNEKKPHN